MPIFRDIIGWIRMTWRDYSILIIIGIIVIAVALFAWYSIRQENLATKFCKSKGMEKSYGNSKVSGFKTYEIVCEKENRTGCFKDIKGREVCKDIIQIYTIKGRKPIPTD